MSDPLTRFTTNAATNSLANSFFGWADRKYSELMIRELLDELTSQDTTLSKDNVAEVTFDLAMRSYMDYMVEAKDKARSPDVRVFFKGLYNWATAEKQPTQNSFLNFLYWGGSTAWEAFNAVGPQIRTRLYTFLSACRSSVGLEEASYSELLGYFLLDTHSEYQKLKAPASHPLAGQSILDLVSPQAAARTIAYLEQRYKGRDLFTHGGKLARSFKKFADALDAGMPTDAATPSGSP